MSMRSDLISLSKSLLIDHATLTNIARSIAQLADKSREFFSYELQTTMAFGPYSHLTLLPTRADGHSAVDLMVVFHSPDKSLDHYLDHLQRFVNKALPSYPNSRTAFSVTSFCAPCPIRLSPAIDVGAASYRIPSVTVHSSPLFYSS
ncbi:MAG: hypothetical protein AABY83_04255 [Pseudomonadota bacterium]